MERGGERGRRQMQHFEVEVGVVVVVLGEDLGQD